MQRFQLQVYPIDRKSLISCINSLRLRAYSVDDRSRSSQLSSGEECPPVTAEAVEVAVEAAVGCLVSLRDARLRVKFIGM